MSTYHGDPWVYILNSERKDKEAKGMKLDYSNDGAWESRAKKAAIVVGGNILSVALPWRACAFPFTADRRPAKSMTQTSRDAGGWVTRWRR